jgi:chromosome segregation ATPase
MEGSLRMTLTSMGGTLETSSSKTYAVKGDDSQPSNEPAVAYIERLLAAIERLRDERDNLRRNVHFLETEAKAVSETNKSDPCDRVGNEAESTDESAIIQYRNNQTLRRMELAATASAIVIGHIQRQADAVDRRFSTQLGNVERQLEGKDQQLSSLTVRLDAAEQRAEDAMAQKTDFQHQVARLQCLDEERLREIERLEDTHQETQAVLIRTTTSLADVTASLEEVESERDSMNLHITNLENDLFCAQQAVSDAESRYSALQFQQLSLLSSDEAVQSLKLQVEELEDRVNRRTEQIGIHQHDIKRLETNLRLQEERVGEMTLELETLSSQKEAMVEDCADAREARDEALRKVEELEVEMEGLEARLGTFENEQDQGVKILVGVIFDIARRSRDSRKANQTNVTRDVQDDPSIDTVRQITLALAASQVELRRTVRSLKAADEVQRSLRQQSKVLEEQLELLRVRNAEVDSSSNPRGTTLEEELEAVHSRHGEELASLQNQITHALNELEEVRQLRADAESRHTEVLDEASRLKQELSDHLKAAADRSKVDEESLQTLRAEHATAVGLLQNQLDDLRKEARQANDSRAKFETLHQQAVDELARVVSDSETSLVRVAERSREVILHLEAEVAKRTDQLVDSGTRLDASSAEVARVTQNLQEEVKNRMLDHEGHVKEQASASERCVRAETVQNELRQELDGTRRQLEETRVALESLQEEKGGLQMEMTGLAAEIQRSISLCRFLESQVKEK